MLALCAHIQVPVILSSDAHDPSDVGNFTLAQALIRDNGFDEQLILNTDMDAFKAFINFIE